MKVFPKPSFVVASTSSGPMIVSRLDWASNQRDGKGHGVGAQLLEFGCYEAQQLASITNLLNQKRQHRGSGVVAVDVGANIGAFAVPLARHMTGWGEVHAFEPQEQVFYALCGNIAINNLRNARSYLGAVTSTDAKEIAVPQLDFDRPGSYGSLSLLAGRSTDVGQETASQRLVRTFGLAACFPGRVDLAKIDVEGMEQEVLDGGASMIEREMPVLVVEHHKSDKARLAGWAETRGYCVFGDASDLLCVHRDDPCLRFVEATTPLRKAG